MRWVGKTRTVRVATPKGDRVYHSLEDVPPELRSLLKQTLEGPNSDTILIANQEAYDRLSRQFQTLPTQIDDLSPAKMREAGRKAAQQLWKWGVGGALGSALVLWLAWLWITQIDT